MNYEIQGADAIKARFEALMQVADIIKDEAAPQICAVMREEAAQNLQDKNAVDTGRLRDSVRSESSEFVTRKGESVVEMGISTDVPYAQFIEYGTGPLGDPAVPHTPEMSWTYRGEDGRFHRARSQEARPFMRPALYDNKEVYTEIIAGTIGSIFEEAGE